MKNFYNFSVIIGRIIGLVSLIIFCYSRVVFFVDWSFTDDIIMCAYIMFVFVAHYALMLLGFKKQILLNTTYNILRIAERIFVILMFVFLGVIFVICWLLQMNTSFQQVCPILMLCIAVPLIRKVVYKKIGNGSVAPSQDDD